LDGEQLTFFEASQFVIDDFEVNNKRSTPITTRRSKSTCVRIFSIVGSRA
jgi:hypothetical protein